MSTRRSARWPVIAVAAAIVSLTACGSSAGTPEAPGGDTSTRSTESDAAEPAIVGRWMQVHSCDQLVGGLEEAGLGAIAPSQIGDFFPNATAEELAAKEDPCSGAKPQRHDHFFAADGSFGSIDQHGEQVDDGTWAVEGDVLRIAEGTWRFEVAGSELSLEPILTQEQVDLALARPLEWAPAGWIVAVAYPGTTWQLVACKGWC